LLPPGTTGTEVPVGGPELADREQAWVVVSSEMVVAWAATVRTLGRAGIPITRREKHLIVPYAASPSSKCRCIRHGALRRVV